MPPPRRRRLSAGHFHPEVLFEVFRRIAVGERIYIEKIPVLDGSILVRRVTKKTSDPCCRTKVAVKIK